MTQQPETQAPAVAGAPIGFVEFVALVAALMSLTALGIDSMLPALPAIGEALNVDSDNHRQFVVTAFVVGFGAAHLIHGPLADRFGRRRVLLCSMAGYAVANAAAAMAGSFTLLLIARVVGGALIAATRVATVALVRDCFHGRAMAKVMSIAFMVFMLVPILAPSFGQGVLLFANWRGIFWAISVASLVVFTWFYLRMPETLKPEDALPLSVGRIVGGWEVTVRDRWSLGYTLASGMLLGALYGYLNSVQQIVSETFGHGSWLGGMFAATSFLMAIANLTNARLVMRLGTRLISHSALTLLILLSAVHLTLALAGIENLWTFLALQAVTMACFGLATSNFSAMAMENMGHIAGTASSVQGFVSVLLGSGIGVVIGQAFDGTTRPLEAGFLICGIISFVIVAITERGRLYRPV
ncbi:DHA1 family bicyclomycin/chloramphenicol resistance-like MFS transporter [Sphingomonas jinjuensis]|uniref:Bcr/CflA family efflux transporter n=1 Tax=Sphingomonas jinjuensis TaxID=535907 RepID=A0A840FG65_9SPHN|nr:multidrug effflux MFS transporter [Sphingomonas jinjuensis]MBB4155186.1 DHA1 family bicyclomycin/chloramphenicol resistance-like MFS transporter [Sphingomonas jinjuensis]